MAILKKNKKKNLQKKAKKYIKTHKTEIGLTGLMSGCVLAAGINAFVTHKKIKELENDISANAEEIYKLQEFGDATAEWIEDHDGYDYDCECDDEEDPIDELSESLAEAVTEAIKKSGANIPDELIPEDE